MQLELPGLQVARVHEDRWVHRGQRVKLVQLVLLGRRVSPVGLECWDLWGPLVLRGLLEHRDSRVSQDQ